jgi:hypothetical protein
MRPGQIALPPPDIHGVLRRQASGDRRASNRKGEVGQKLRFFGPIWHNPGCRKLTGPRSSLSPLQPPAAIAHGIPAPRPGAGDEPPRRQRMRKTGTFSQFTGRRISPRRVAPRDVPAATSVPSRPRCRDWIPPVTQAPAALPSPHRIAEVGGPTCHDMRHTVMARRLGIHPKTIRRQFARGGLPGAKEHGPRILMVPTSLVRLAETYGLRGVERMARAGLIAGAV